MLHLSSAFGTPLSLRYSQTSIIKDNALPITTRRPNELATIPRHTRSLVPTLALDPGTVNRTTIPATMGGLFTSTSFASLGLEPIVVASLQEMSIVQPTTVQSRGIPAILSGGDVILGAATGSGKTLAYLLPVVQALKNAEALRMDSDPPLRVRRRPRAIILVPTRELADQVLGVGRALAHGIKFRIASAVGGTSESIRRLNMRWDQPIDVLVATTGRLLQLVRERELDVRFVSHVVIDEVDTMFDKGFGPEVRQILSAVRSIPLKSESHSNHSSNLAQLVAAGATHPPEAVSVYQETFIKAVRIDVDLHMAPVGLEQRFIRVRGDSKLSELPSLVRDDDASRTGVMIFCNTVESCRFVHHYLTEINIAAVCVHGDMPAVMREREYARFATMDGESERAVLVCTDVTGRGVDHAKVGHVILFDFPASAVDYVHRAGRTARAGAKGRVTSFVTKKDENLARALENAGRGRVDALESERASLRALEERKRREREAERERENAESVDSSSGDRGRVANVKNSRKMHGHGKSPSHSKSSAHAKTSAYSKSPTHQKFSRTSNVRGRRPSTNKR